jgi:hypothetical protein
MRERILGYDIREMWYEDQFDLIKHGRFKKMLSTAGSLWGSLFDQGDCPDLVGPEREKYGLGTVELPELLVVGMNRPFWTDLGAMLDYAQTHAPRSGRLYWIVAITICLEDPEQELKEREEWPYYSEPVPGNLQDDWVLVGYDVTSCYSESMISGELGPGLESGDPCEFAHHLNQYLLFSSIAKAEEFSKALDVSNENESPHTVYGIWKASETRY